MNELIENILQWGTDKGILGPDGKGNPYAQSAKVLEEAKETVYAVGIHDLDEVKDGIGDVLVTIAILVDMYGWTLEECGQHAYGVISKRSGKMVDGQFIKN